MNILLDASVVFGELLFRSLGHLRVRPAHQISTEDIRWADALICRSKVQVNAKLCAEHSLLFVGTATTGIDHLDEDFLSARSVPYSHASGCNAQAVSDYVMASLCQWLLKKNRTLAGLSVGVLAYGHVGKAVADKFRQLGLAVKLSDPPLAAVRGKEGFDSLASVMASDIISLHAPLVTHGQWPTAGLVNEEALRHAAAEALLLSCGRGEVVPTRALTAWACEPGHCAVVDVWENEPLVDQRLLDSAWMATPHIAGYSLDGRAKGTLMVRSAFLQALGLADEPIPTVPELARSEPVSTQARSLEDALHLVSSIYNPELDHSQFQASQGSGDRAAAFRAFRQNYWLRRDFNQIGIRGAQGEAADFLAAIGFALL